MNVHPALVNAVVLACSPHGVVNVEDGKSIVDITAARHVCKLYVLEA